MNDILLTVKDIHKIYRNGAKEIRAVNGVSLEITKGESLAIVGPSGAGKSTLLHMLGGLDKPTSGKILLDNTDIYKLPDKDRASIRNKRIGFVFQFYHLMSELTALENVMLPMLISGVGSRAKGQVTEKAKSILKSVELSDRISHLPSRLSGGEMQRVAIARALINEPEILLCDEPTGNLDSKTSESIYRLLLELKTNINTTLIVVTHDKEIASKLDKTLHIKDGKIVSQ